MISERTSQAWEVALRGIGFIVFVRILLAAVLGPTSNARSPRVRNISAMKSRARSAAIGSEVVSDFSESEADCSRPVLDFSALPRLPNNMASLSVERDAHGRIAGRRFDLGRRFRVKG